MSPTSRPSVAFLVRHVHHYRESFYLGLRDELDRRGVDFELIHGDPSPAERSKNDSVRPEWSTFRPNRVLRVGSNELILQPAMGTALRADLVLVEQASRLLLNYALQIRHALPGGPALGLVGHGANLAASPHPVGEWLKRVTLRRSDWFFGYTNGTRRRLVDAGYPSDKITVFENTLDTSDLRRHLDAVTEADVAEFRASLGLEGRYVVLTLGSLYPDKRPDLIVPVLDLVSAHRSDVDFVVVGSGPSTGDLEKIERRNLRICPARFGRDKAVALRAADLLLVPGVAGLIVLDSFVSAVPIVMARNDHHPPEVDYLAAGANCSIAETNDPGALASALRHLLEHPDERDRLAQAALLSGEPLTVQNMVRRFCDGVEAVLDQRGSRRKR